MLKTKKLLWSNKQRLHAQREFYTRKSIWCLAK